MVHLPSIAGLVVLALSTLTIVHGHSYHLGSCPAVEPMPDFVMNKFLGKWYVVQKTSTGSRCLTNNYTALGRSGEFQIEQVSEHFLLGLTSVDHKYRYTGELKAKDLSVPAKMTVKFPFSVAGSAQYTVFMTDYEHYAGVFTCQRLAFAHRQSASILSRSPVLDKVFVDKIRNRLASFGVDPFDLSIINQTACAGVQAPDGYDININPDTLSAGSVAGVVRKAGEKIGDGIETVAEGAKKVYNRVHGERNERDREELISPDRQYTEWLP